MRTTVNIDDASLQAARNALGTKGLTETVNRALEEVARHLVPSHPRHPPASAP
jgi:Arc/MetJ family transcription regulator